MHYPEFVLCGISVVGVIVGLVALSAGFLWPAALIIFRDDADLQRVDFDLDPARLEVGTTLKLNVGPLRRGKIEVLV